MVTSHKTAENKAVAMSNESAGVAASAAVAGARPRTLLGEVNEHLTCVLCRGYYIDATTIVECLHSFCRSCIIKHLQVESFCPDCGMMINAAKPNIKPDKALQDIVYKLVPGLFQREMERRQQFYASRPGPAADATPEQRGEDTERIIFSSEDVISFSLEYVDNTETESISSRSSESGNEIAPNSATGAATRRYLQCPAVVNISHLKKFLGMKFDVDSSYSYIDILYKRVPLSDYYTLMDIAYIYNWKRNEPMRFFYKITDYTAIRSRYGFFDIGRTGSFRQRKLSSTIQDVGSPALHDSDASSGANSPVPPLSMDQNCKSLIDFNEHLAKHGLLSRVDIVKGSICDDNSEDSNLSVSSIVGLVSPSRQSPELDVEKSQFLNSFELTARNSSGSRKSLSPAKSATENCTSRDSSPQPNVKTEKSDSHQRNVKSEKFDSALRAVKSEKLECSPKSTSKSISSTKPEEVPSKKRSTCQENISGHDSKKRKVEESKTEIKFSKGDSLQLTSMSQKTLNTVTQLSANIDSSLNKVRSLMNVSAASTNQSNAQKNIVTPPKEKKIAAATVTPLPASAPIPAATYASLAPKHKSTPTPEHSSAKRLAPASFKISSPKRKPQEEITASQTHKTVSPIKLQVLKPEEKKPVQKLMESPKPSQLSKRLPELKLSIVGAGQPNPQVINRSQLPASSTIPNVENSKESKNLPAPVEINPPVKNSTPPNDPLRSLFDNCKINIPSSLSITLTDQKNDPNNDSVGRSGSGVKSTGTPKPPPPVHNSIEILRLPDLDLNKKPARPELKAQPNVTKSGEVVSSKGPVPNLKPISDTKPGKSSGSFTKPQTFQQTFLQAISQQLPEKPRYPNKSKVQMPKLNAMQVSKPGEQKEATLPASQITKNLPASEADPDNNETPKVSIEKLDSVLDLSTPHAMQSQLGPQQTKALETMQSIANLAKKQTYPQKLSSNIGQGLPSFTQGTTPKTAASPSPLRIPIANSQNKQMRMGSPMRSSPVTSPRPDHFQSVKLSNLRAVHNSSPVQASKSPSLNTSGTFQNSFTQPRSQTRSPSSSPKLVIACPSPKSQSPDDKQLASPKVSESSNSQSSSVSNTQTSFSEPGPSKSFTTKPPSKIFKPLLQNKTSNARSSNANLKKTPSNTLPVPGDLVHLGIPPQLLQQQAFIRQQLQIQSQLGLLSQNAATQWFNNSVARAHLDTIMKNISHSDQPDYNNPNKDKK